MNLTATNVTNQARVYSIFEELYTSSEPYMSVPNNSLALRREAQGLTAKEQFKLTFFKGIQEKNPEAGILLIKIDDVPLSLMVYSLGEDKLVHTKYALYNDYEGSRSWMYGAIMKEHYQKEIEYFKQLNVLGYTVTTAKDSPIYNYHVLNRPDIATHFIVSEKPSGRGENGVIVTLLFP